jgi:ElaA protein
MKITWKYNHFSKLSAGEWHDILQLRINVFIVEQNCPYPELDGKDKEAFHVYGINEKGETIAVSRILKPGVSYPQLSIGRVAVSKEVRLHGAGIELMKKTLDITREIFGENEIRISAQEYLRNFYEKFGFVKITDSYLEDDIPHIGMLRK